MATFPGGIEINPPNSAVVPGLMNAAALYGQVQQMQAQQAEIEGKKKEARVGVAQGLFTNKNLPTRYRVNAFNKVILPYVNETAPDSGMGPIDESAFQDDSFNQVMDNIMKVQGDTSLDDKSKKTIALREIAGWQNKNGYEKEAMGTVERIIGDDAPRESFQFVGTNPATGGGIVMGSRSGEFQERALPGKLTPKTVDPNLSPTDINRVTEGASVLRMLQDVEQTIDDNKDVFGPLVGRARGNNPYDTKAQTVRAEMRAKSQAFGRFMEGGVLRKEDEIKYEKMFPQTSDTKEVAKSKARVVNKLLVKKYADLIDALKQSGYSTGGLAQPENNGDQDQGNSPSPAAPAQGGKFKIISIEDQ